jgi:tetratricopeptide (TPR) repeat protein
MSSIDEERSLLSLLIESGQLNEAICLAEQIKEKYDDPYAWLDYAMLLMSTSGKEAAMVELRKLLSAHPDFPHGWHNLAGLLMGMDLAEAEKALRRTIQLAPNDATARMNLGYVFYRTGRIKAAITSMRKSVKLEPTAEACYNLGRILRVTGRKEEARNLYIQSLTLNAKFYPAQDELDEMAIE